MVTNRDHDYNESAGFESSQTESDTSGSGWESGFINLDRSTARYSRKSSRALRVDKGIRKRPAKSISSSDSDNDMAPKTLHKRVKYRIAKSQNNPTKLQVGANITENLLSPDESDELDSEDGSETDPDIDTDDTISESEDNGYADTTKENVAGMYDLWERYVEMQSIIKFTLTEV
jgi:hypothetical protein